MTTQAPQVIKHPNMGTPGEVRGTVSTVIGEVAAAKDRYGWCFYLLPSEELVGLIFRGNTCFGVENSLVVCNPIGPVFCRPAQG